MIAIRPVTLADSEFVVEIIHRAFVPRLQGNHRAYAQRLVENACQDMYGRPRNPRSKQYMNVAKTEGIVGVHYFIASNRAIKSSGPLIVRADMQGCGVAERLMQALSHYDFLPHTQLMYSLVPGACIRDFCIQ